MKPIKALSILALVAGVTAPAHAEPTPASAPQGQIMAGPGDGAAGPLTAKTATTIQSPRDPASGQSSNTAAGSYWEVSPEVRSTQPSGSFFDEYDTGGVQTVARSSSGTNQSTAPEQNPKARSQPNGLWEDHFAVVSPTQDNVARTETAAPAPQGMVFTNDSIDKIELVVAQGGTSAGTYREGGVNDTTHRAKKPRRDGTGKRSKRVRKP